MYKGGVCYKFFFISGSHVDLNKKWYFIMYHQWQISNEFKCVKQCFTFDSFTVVIYFLKYFKQGNLPQMNFGLSVFILVMHGHTVSSIRSYKSLFFFFQAALLFQAALCSFNFTKLGKCRSKPLNVQWHIQGIWGIQIRPRLLSRLM